MDSSYSPLKWASIIPRENGRRVALGRRKKLINHTNIPQHKIEAIARCIMPDILAFYESEEGQKEFAEWKLQQQSEKDGVRNNDKQ